MSSPPRYSRERLNTMNYGALWNQGIIIPENIKNKSDEWQLHATGDADLNGRKYVALPPGTNTKDPNIIKKYNLI